MSTEDDPVTPDLLAQADKAAGWLTVCPRDDWPLTLQPDGTETCPECAWHTGDPIVPPEVVAQRLAQARQRRIVLRDVVLVAWGLVLFVAGNIWNQPVMLLLAVWLVGLPAFLHYRRSPHDGPPEPVTKGLVRGRGKTPTRPPPPAHRPSTTPPVANVQCPQCQRWMMKQDASTWCPHYRHYRRPKPCRVCGVSTDSTSGECPSCEVHDGDWSYQQARLGRQIVASFSVPPILGPVARSGIETIHAYLGAAVTATDTILLLDRPAPWREGTLVEVAIDPDRATEERVLVAPQGAILMVQCRGYDGSVAQPHITGAEVRVVRARLRHPL